MVTRRSGEWLFGSAVVEPPHARMSTPAIAKTTIQIRTANLSGLACCQEPLNSPPPTSLDLPATIDVEFRDAGCCFHYKAQVCPPSVSAPPRPPEIISQSKTVCVHLADGPKTESPLVHRQGAFSCLESWCRRSDSRPNIPFCRFVSGSVPLSIPNTVPIVPVAPYRHV